MPRILLKKAMTRRPTVSHRKINTIQLPTNSRLHRVPRRLRSIRDSHSTTRRIIKCPQVQLRKQVQHMVRTIRQTRLLTHMVGDLAEETKM